MSTNRESMANGNVVQATATQDTSGPRRFAAAIDRDHPAVQRIRANVLHDATVWLADSGGEDGEKLHIPDGWVVDGTFVTSDGAVALQVSREGDA